MNAFVAHGVFPNESWKRFMKSGDRGCFDRFYLTNSIPTVTPYVTHSLAYTHLLPQVTDSLPRDDVFVILDLVDKIVTDLDKYS